jgi:hypothetical protein
MSLEGRVSRDWRKLINIDLPAYTGPVMIFWSLIENGYKEISRDVYEDMRKRVLSKPLP